MWKHNKPSKFLSKKAPSVLKKIMDSGRKHGKALKKKHAEDVKLVREQVKAIIVENQKRKKEKEIQDKQKQASLLNDLLSQGGLCNNKQELDKLLSQPNAFNNLKIQIRFRKYYMGESDLRLTGNFKTLYHRLCSHLKVEDYDDDDDDFEPPTKKEKNDIESGSESTEGEFED